MTTKMSFGSISLSASVDHQTGSLSVFDIFEECRVESIPHRLPTLVLSFVFSRSETHEKEPIALSVFHRCPSEGTRLIAKSEVHFPKGKRRLKAVMRFGGIHCRSFGEHALVMSAKSTGGMVVEDAEFPFEIRPKRPKNQDLRFDEMDETLTH